MSAHMSALPPSQVRAMRAFTAQAPAPAATRSAVPLASLETRWDALQFNGLRIARLAQLGPLDDRGTVENFSALLSGANGWQYELAQRGIEDLDAIMDIGLKALATLTERGQDTRVPALALWREFYHGREAVLAILEPHLDAA